MPIVILYLHPLSALSHRIFLELNEKRNPKPRALKRHVWVSWAESRLTERPFTVLCFGVRECNLSERQEEECCGFGRWETERGGVNGTYLAYFRSHSSLVQGSLGTGRNRKENGADKMTSCLSCGGGSGEVRELDLNLKPIMSTAQ